MIYLWDLHNVYLCTQLLAHINVSKQVSVYLDEDYITDNCKWFVSRLFIYGKILLRFQICYMCISIGTWKVKVNRVSEKKKNQIKIRYYFNKFYEGIMKTF